MNLLWWKRKRTVAFVLSGGGNYGSLQVGALQVLLEADIRPHLLVGTSAGALNAAFLAIDPTLEGAQRLGEIWCSVRPEDVGTRANLAILPRLLANKMSFYDSQPLARFLEARFPPDVRAFGDLELPAYAVAVRLPDGALRVFGDDPADQLLDGMMSSSAITPFYPPWTCDNMLYIDGGVATKLPLEVAVERGAQEIYALDIKDPLGRMGERPKVMGIAGQAMSLMMAQQVAMERASVRRRGVRLHTITLDHGGLPFWDFGHASELIARGRAAAEAVLENQKA